VTRNIPVNGNLFPVTVNLESALRHLREHNRYVAEEAVFWIDALCINQRDVEEKMQQVRLMGGIYKSCREVVMYLGDRLEGDAPTERAPRMLRFDIDGRAEVNKTREYLLSKGHRQIEVDDVFRLISELSHMKHLDDARIFAPYDVGLSGKGRQRLLEALREMMHPPFTP